MFWPLALSCARPKTIPTHVPKPQTASNVTLLLVEVADGVLEKHLANKDAILVMPVVLSNQVIVPSVREETIHGQELLVDAVTVATLTTETSAITASTMDVVDSVTMDMDAEQVLYLDHGIHSLHARTGDSNQETPPTPHPISVHNTRHAIQ